MKNPYFLIPLLLTSISALAQTPSRTVTISWTPSVSSSVTGTSIQMSTTAATGPYTQIACVGTVSGSTCVSGSTASTSTYNDTEAVGSTVWYQLIAVAPACTSSTPVGTPCGNSVPSASVSVPIPPQPSSVTTIVVTVK